VSTARPESLNRVGHTPRIAGDCYPHPYIIPCKPQEGDQADMPDLEREYAGLCVDTSIFDRHAIALEKGLLKQLEQFANGNATLLIPHVIRFELQRHLSKRVGDAMSHVARALKEASNELLIDDAGIREARSLLLPHESSDNVAKKRIEDFMERCGAELLPPSNVGVSELLEMYFSSKPPFEVSGAKKAEFPDAIALLSLVAWARERGAYLLAVSADKGWADFAKEFDCLTVVDDLAEALAHFQGHHFADEFVDRLKKRLLGRSALVFEEAIKAALEIAIESAAVEAVGDSVLHADEEYVQAAYDRHEYVRGEEGDPDVQLVRTKGREIVVRISVVGRCEITAGYRLSVRDSVDRAYVSLGSVKVSAEEEFTGEVLLTLRGNFAGEVDTIEIEEQEAEVEIPVVYFDVGFEPEDE
jgi:hypothetical protein